MPCPVVKHAGGGDIGQKTRRSRVFLSTFECYLRFLSAEQSKCFTVLSSALQSTVEPLFILFTVHQFQILYYLQRESKVSSACLVLRNSTLILANDNAVRMLQII